MNVDDRYNNSTQGINVKLTVAIKKSLPLTLLLTGWIASGCGLADTTQDSMASSTNHQHNANHTMQPITTPSRPLQVPAMGEIKAVDRVNRKLKVMHQPIEAWNMGAMQMSFHLAPEVDITALKAGMNIHFRLQNPSIGKFIITEIMSH